jgi:hypothetical protein
MRNTLYIDHLSAHGIGMLIGSLSDNFCFDSESKVGLDSLPADGLLSTSDGGSYARGGLL